MTNVHPKTHPWIEVRQKRTGRDYGLIWIYPRYGGPDRPALRAQIIRTGHRPTWWITEMYTPAEGEWFKSEGPIIATGLRTIADVLDAAHARLAPAAS